LIKKISDDHFHFLAFLPKNPKACEGPQKYKGKKEWNEASLMARQSQARLHVSYVRSGKVLKNILNEVIRQGYFEKVTYSVVLTERLLTFDPSNFLTN
jgi:hypothetical protein